MLLSSRFLPFLEARPLCVLARAILQRFLDPAHLDRLFEAHARRQYTRSLLFSTAVELLSQVVLGVQPSLHAAYQALADRVPVSDQAVYDKLNRAELPTSAALVADSARRAEPLIRALGAAAAPWLPGYRTRVIDGNHLGATEHRLKETRDSWAPPLPGQALVVMDQELATATHVLLAEDGQAQERSLLGEVVPLVERGDLWLGDRNFCTLGFLFAIADRGGRFAIRQHGMVLGEPAGASAGCGRCDTGGVREQRLRLRHGGRVLVVRRVSVELDRPTRDGDTEVHILTNLPARDAKAAAVAELYRKRWTIEGLFLEVAQTLDCEIDALCYPRAALLAFCVGLLAYNAAAVLKAALRAAHGEGAVREGLSGYYVAAELRRTYDGMMVAVPAQHWGAFSRASDTEMAGWLKGVAVRVSLARYKKHARGPKKRPPWRRRCRNGEHVATAKLLAARKRRA